VSRSRRGGSPTVVNLSFLDQSRYFSVKELLIYPHKSSVDPVTDPLLLTKSGRIESGTSRLGARYCQALKGLVLNVNTGELPDSLAHACESQAKALGVGRLRSTTESRH
jgi:hypothetical protein